MASACKTIARTEKTGAKEKSSSKKSTRAKSYKEARHARKGKGAKGGGQFTKTSAASKKKYGKKGTTKAKLVAKCRKGK